MRQQQVARDDRATAALRCVVNETRRLFHGLRQASDELHAADDLPAGERAVVVELAEEGPKTVPQMARARPVSRQHIQTLVNGLFERQLVELTENPLHKRSKRVQLTRKGKALAARVATRERAVLSRLAAELDAAALEETAEVLRQVKQVFAASHRQGKGRSTRRDS